MKPMPWLRNLAIPTKQNHHHENFNSIKKYINIEVKPMPIVK